MSQSPAVSVLLPVFNGIRHLREAVDSILGQTFADFEFIIIDDGSTDDSAKTLQQYAQVDSRIRLVSRPNKGLTVTLNEGVGMASAPLLARMDADDIALPQRLEKQTAYMREHPDCVLLGSAVTLIDPEGLPIRQMCSEQTHEEIDYAHLNRGWPIVHPAVESFVITPICPHTLSDRPVVVRDSSSIEMKLLANTESVFLTLDGQKGIVLQATDFVRITRAQEILRLIQPLKKSYFEILRNKLKWGEA